MSGSGNGYEELTFHSLVLVTVGDPLHRSFTAASNLSRALGYLIAAPSVFRAGVEEAVSVTIFNPVKETTVQVQLAVKGETVAHSHGTVPSGLRGQAHLKVWGNRHLADEGYIFHNYTTVTVDAKGSSVFIQTDKPVYKPKQKGLL
ncbi:C3 and PZP-like alpha-2-macroglobulin domain-containing protein 8 [Acipenser ruthenus]|uniref:C3 and PZP-like alpha-2-macroglobulin domain-containing protein 8 n=1 Tax=Acipenser ruthenus TaxID=7906 RepID=A0A444USK1_ACIRT|nr:C3 and PZP-like alpha-2-macroglobulin domain-containing protein 8 [Acipenser ruthenus]